MRSAIAILLLSVFLSVSCDSVLRQTAAQEETLEFGDDTSFVIREFVSRLPIVVLETDGREIPDDPRIRVRMGIVSNNYGQVNQYGDDFTGYDGPVSIEIRGFTSQNFPKKQYAFETQDESGESADVELLGLPRENDWILYAPYSDKAMIRNVLIYRWWRGLGRYASRTRFCEVVLNGRYQGVYILMEQIKWGRDRVDIAKMDADDNQGNSLTGGYIFKVDKAWGGDGMFDWKTGIEEFQGVKANVSFQYDYPKDGKITPSQQHYIQQFVQEFEQSLISSSFSEANGYRKYADPASFIDFFLLQEVSHNVDGYRSSTFLHKQRDSKGGRLSAGPLWDFNLALGNTTGCEGEKTEGWALDHPCDPTFIPFWWKRMAQDSMYVQELRNRWWELREGSLSDETVLADIDEAVKELGGSVARNDRRWHVLGVHVWPNYFVGETYGEEIAYLKEWLLKRLQWMDANIPRPDR